MSHMSNEMFTQLPSVVSSQMGDIIAAVQGYVSPSSPGLSVQQTLGQVYSLFNANIILNYAGNPNGNMAGTTYQFCWDTADNVMFVCTVTGTSSTAVWKPLYGSMTDGQLIIGSTSGVPQPATLTAGPGISIVNGPNSITISGTSSGLGWSTVTAATQAMVADNGYVANRVGGVAFTLPTTAAFGTGLAIVGYGAGGWTLAQNAGQSIQIGTSTTTIGAGGSIASTHASDTLFLTCIVANTVWATNGAPMSSGLTIV